MELPRVCHCPLVASRRHGDPQGSHLGGLPLHNTRPQPRLISESRLVSSHPIPPRSLHSLPRNPLKDRTDLAIQCSPLPCLSCRRRQRHPRLLLAVLSATLSTNLRHLCIALAPRPPSTADTTPLPPEHLGTSHLEACAHLEVSPLTRAFQPLHFRSPTRTLP